MTFKKLLTLAAAVLCAGSMWASDDVTNTYLTNANLSTVNSGWTYYSDAYKYTDWKTDGDVPVVEFYSQWNAGDPVSITQKDFKFSQTVTLPAGYYRLAVNAFYRNGRGDGTNEDKAWIFVKGTGIDKSQNVTALTSAGVASYTGSSDLYKAANAFSRGDFSNEFDFSLESATEVEIGFQGFFNLSLSWCILGPVKLYEYTAADYMDDYRTKVAAAEALYSTPMYADDLSALKAAVVEESTLTTVDDVQNAISTLNAAIIAANNSITAYAADIVPFNTLKASADALAAVAYTEITSGSHDTFTAAIAAQQAAADAAANASALTVAITTLKTAMIAYVGDANPVGDGAKFDCTFMMTNPDLTGFATWNPAAGWASEESDGNSQVMVNDSKTNGEYSYFYEYWSDPAKASGKFALYNAVTLPAGTFEMSCYAFAEDQYTSSTVDGVYFYANDTQGSCVTNTKLTKQTLSFVNSSEQEVNIGLKTLTGNTRNWMGIGYVELYKVPAQTYTINETATYDNTQSGAGDVTLKRTISVGLNTLVLPFSMTQTEVEETFGTGSKVYVVSAYDAGKENITFAVQSGIQPNVPCLLEATVAGTSYNIEGRTIVAGTPTVSVTGLDFVGTYTYGEYVPMDSYVISGSNIYKVDSNVSIKSTRAYFTVTATGAAPSRLTWSFDGDATGIDAIDSERVANGAIYNLNGQRVNTLQKGINIVNGKKVFVK